jgi:hypothetical protein
MKEGSMITWLGKELKKNVVAMIKRGDGEKMWRVPCPYSGKEVM